MPTPLPMKLPAAKATELATHPKNSLRELVETVVFVTVLVLLLKSFVAEAFVIPTGSMAETLHGWRAYVTCPSCLHEFPVNASEEIDPHHGQPTPITGCTCPNCELHIRKQPGDNWIRKPDWLYNSGDRVLVAKWPLQQYQRWDVVVFKYPKDPQQNWVPMNYIKRLIGLPGDTIAINNGDLFVGNDIKYEGKDQPPRELDRWKQEYRYVNAQEGDEAFRAGKFRILRKPPDQILTMRRLVYNNDHQPKDLVGKVEPRWQARSGWTPNNSEIPTAFTRNEDAAADSWITYQHRIVQRDSTEGNVSSPGTVELIKNAMGYNDGEPGPPSGKTYENYFWVGDLMIECEVDVTTAAGEFTLELSKGADRFQARFDLTNGDCRLVRVGKVSIEALGQASTTLRGVGKHFVRFANFDERLTVWVDSTLPFGDGKEYAGDHFARADDANNMQPASFGTFGAARVQVSHLQLHRDTYYTSVGKHDRSRAPGEPEMTMFVQPGHYLCMGDNSTQSSDGRDWGTVPERLMQGKAQMVYFPVWPFAHRFGPIR